MAALFVYIRWVDQWFRQHADEEFRLKRMSLDVDRASWVVETAMEWQAQNKAEIPPQLLEQLTRDLFMTSGQSTGVRHPAEDLANAVLAASSSPPNMDTRTPLDVMRAHDAGVTTLYRYYAYPQGDDKRRGWVDDLLLRGELYFPTAGQFNDPFDARPTFSPTHDAPGQTAIRARETLSHPSLLANAA